jgi:hypothetical protein
MSASQEPKPGQPNPGRAQKAGSCPVCGKPAVAAFRPFCSDRCRKVDLNRWLSEAYRIPAAEADRDGEKQSESED